MPGGSSLPGVEGDGSEQLEAMTTDGPFKGSSCGEDRETGNSWRETGAGGMVFFLRWEKQEQVVSRPDRVSAAGEGRQLQGQAKHAEPGRRVVDVSSALPGRHRTGISWNMGMGGCWEFWRRW